MNLTNHVERCFPHFATCTALLLVIPMTWAQETKEKVTVDNVDRTFMVRLTRGYDPQHPYPVVILLHGMNQDADDNGAAHPV